MRTPCSLISLLVLLAWTLAGCGSSQPGTVRVRPASIAIPGRPVPLEETYRGCPPAGRGNEDPFINQLKNRVDRPAHPVTFTFRQIEGLDWPPGVTDVVTARWPAAARARIFRHDGAPVRFTGYLSSADAGGPEPANCNQPGVVDWHLWLGPQPHLPHTLTFIAEIPPRIRARESGFDLNRLRLLAARGLKVRVTGWLMFDSEHPEQPNQRATIWEIHPVTHVEVWSAHAWHTVAGL